jgi:hypothetical protein
MKDEDGEKQNESPLRSHTSFAVSYPLLVVNCNSALPAAMS